MLREENPMRRFVLALAAALIAAAIGLPAPAAATEAREAIKLCDQRAAKTKDCSYGVLDNGSVVINVGKACNNDTCVIECPQVGQCTCSVCPSKPTKPRAGAGSVRGSTAGVFDALTASPVGPRGTTGVRPGGAATK